MIYKYTFWIIVAVSIFLFVYPFGTIESTGMGLDKVVHFVLFGVLAWAGFKANWRKVLLSLVLIVYAFGVEFFQGTFLPWRSFDWYDAVAGTLGVVVVLLFSKR